MESAMCPVMAPVSVMRASRSVSRATVTVTCRPLRSSQMADRLAKLQSRDNSHFAEASVAGPSLSSTKCGGLRGGRGSMPAEKMRAPGFVKFHDQDAGESAYADAALFDIPP